MTDERLHPPASLTQDQRRIWTETLGELLAAGTTRRVSPDSLHAYVIAVHAHRRAAQLITQTDILIDHDGTPRANPALDILTKNAGIIAQFARQFGLNRAPVTDTMAMRPVEHMAKPVEDRGRWCSEHGRWECISPRSRGRGICHGASVVGQPRCKNHLGARLDKDAKHLLALEQRANPLAGEPMDISPAEALLWRVRVLSGEVARLDVKIASLEAEELVWGRVSEEVNGAAEFPGTKTVMAARLSQWIVLREQRERVLHSACEAALRAGIEERLVRVAEQYGATLHKVMLGALLKFGIEPSDPRIPEVMPAVIRELTAS